MPSFNPSDLPAYQAKNLALDFITVKHACPSGIYLAPSSIESRLWEGVLFVRQGPYAPGVFRFHVEFPTQYPQRPPSISFSTEVFHPLITPLTTYTYTTQDTGTDTVSASDDERLPPGGLSLRHGFPQWFGNSAHLDSMAAYFSSPVVDSRSTTSGTPHILDVLYYLRSAFMSEDFLNSIPLNMSANPNAWHAWHTFQSKPSRSSSISQQGGRKPSEASDPYRQQPGGARKPGEWNWDGVWEDRIRKAVQSSFSEQALFGKNATQDDLIAFFRMDENAEKHRAP